MKRPVWTVVALPSRGLDDLAATVSAWRKALTALRRRALFRPVRAGCGALETRLSRQPSRWDVHAHLVLDVDELDFAAVTAAWRGYHEDRGVFKAAHRPEVDMGNVIRLSAYTAKADTWCPAPGKMSTAELNALLAGLRSKQLLVRWGLR